MKRRCLLIAAVALTGCAQYATVSEIRPRFHPMPSSAGSVVAVQQAIATALSRERSAPWPALGELLTAAEAASQTLARNPNDNAAREAYNFAVARVFSTMQRTKRDPWAQPLRVPAAGGDFTLHYVRDPKPARYAGLYDYTPADQFDIKGTYVTERTVKAGLGAPLVAVGKTVRADAVEHFAQERAFYGVTGLIRFEKGRHATIFFGDPLDVETVQLVGHTFPLAADFTIPLAVMLARENPKKLEISRVLHPEKYANTAHIVRLQPYDPDKTVVVVTHGLMDSPATWTPMLNALRGDPVIRQNYQFWFYSYPSGYPYPYSGAIMRQQLDAIEKRYPPRKPIVLIGHSMGSLISRLMITDSGDKLWLSAFGKPPGQVRMSEKSRKLLESALIFHHRPEIGRVIFISGPHRGSEMAIGWAGRLGSRLIKAPITLLKVSNEIRAAVMQDASSLRLNGVPNSIDTLAPNNRFVKAINTVPITPGIPYHSIMGDRGKGGNKDRTPPVNTDGVVPYWSSHLDGAQSELIVPSNHSAHQNPQAIAEVRRILRMHVGLRRANNLAQPHNEARQLSSSKN